MLMAWQELVIPCRIVMMYVQQRWCRVIHVLPLCSAKCSPCMHESIQGREVRTIASSHVQALESNRLGDSEQHHGR